MNPPRSTTAFDPTAPLPSGLTALEASAGTGKTFALTALAVRYVAEQGVPASGLCIVSFTEAATAELRGRVRSRLVSAARHLESVLAGASTESPPGPAEPGGSRVAPDADVDVIDATIADTDVAGRRERLGRLRTALAEFDAATITTIHGFCGRVLAASGAESADRAIDTGELEIDEVVNDLFLSRFGHLPDTLVTVSKVTTAVRAHLGMPDSVLHLEGGPTRTPTPAQELYLRDAEEARRLISDAADEVRRRREQRRRRTFDALLADTRALLGSPDGAVTVAALRERLRVVLIDEFQDTDQVQWDIFRTAFVGAPDTSVVLVGDPKQSIYRFRSAELSAYLGAISQADEGATLTTNWRSDGPLLDALETLFTTPDGHSAQFGSAEVAFAPVQPAPRRAASSLHGDDDPPLVVRHVPSRSGRLLASPTARRLIADDLVTTVQRLLSSGLNIAAPADATDTEVHASHPGVSNPGGSGRPLRASDIAILTRSNADASFLAARLAAAGVPAATSSSNSVMDSEAAEQWRQLLLALERPGSPGRARAAALGWFVGCSIADLAAFDDADLDRLHDQLRGWADSLSTGGVAALLTLMRSGGTLMRSGGLDAWLLAGPMGERHLTDLDHIAELLLDASSGRAVGAHELLEHLRSLSSESSGGPAADLLARRIDRDDDAVQLLTIHTSKGREFPVVLCPTLWTAAQHRGIPHAHVDGERRLDVSWVAGASDWSWLKPLRAASRAEDLAESRRLLYVALTRAQHRLVIWWPAVAKMADEQPLADVLRAASGADGVPSSIAALQPLVDRSAGTIGVETLDIDRAPSRSDPPTDEGPSDPDAPTQPRQPTRPEPPELHAATVRRRLDRQWRIWSFTGVSAAGEIEHESSPVMGGTDEPASAEAGIATPLTTTTAPIDVAPGRLRTLVGGTEFGTLVHEILEHTDFAATDLDEHLAERCAERLRFRSLRVDADELAAGLAEAVRAPLGGPVGNRALSDIARADRLDELEFHVPLGSIRVGEIGAVLAEHLLPDDPFRPWALDVAEGRAGIDPALAITGRLIGSIDLVWRHGGRVHVADYKTNQLGVDHPYDRQGLIDAMTHHRYPLQAILYLVALHRYLRWRLPDYSAERHLGGAAYLFVRGMTSRAADQAPPSGADADGVLWWQPSVSAVSAIDRLLAGARP